MARRPSDPTLHALAKEAADLSFPSFVPVADPKGVIPFVSGRGLYAYLRLRGRQVILGTFSAGQDAQAQLYTDACRVWFAPYLRARPEVEHPEARFNFSREEAQRTLSSVPGLEPLLCRIENHLQDQQLLPDRDSITAPAPAKRPLSPTKRLNSRLDLFQTTLEELRTSINHLASLIEQKP